MDSETLRIFASMSRVEREYYAAMIGPLPIALPAPTRPEWRQVVNPNVEQRQRMKKNRRDRKRPVYV